MEAIIDSDVFSKAREQWNISAPDQPWDSLSLGDQMRIATGGPLGDVIDFVAPALESAPSLGEDPQETGDDSSPGMRSCAPGIYADIDAITYHLRELGVINKGALDCINKSPAHYKDWVVRGHDEPESAALDFGRAFHCAVLEPHVFAKTYAVAPDFGDGRTKAAKAAKAEFEAANAGRELISANDSALINAMAESVRRHPIANQLLRGGAPEVTLRWDDDETGLPCKARADYYVASNACCIDIKSTQDASPKGFARACEKYRYHVQAAHYSSGFAALGKPLETFVFIVVEKTAPYPVAVYVLDADAEAKGRAAYRANVQTFAEAMNTGEFPAYGDGIMELTLSKWAV